MEIPEKYKVVTAGFFSLFAGLLGLWIAVSGLVTGKVKSPAGPDSFNTFAADPFTFTFAAVIRFAIGIHLTPVGAFMPWKGLTKLFKA